MLRTRREDALAATRRAIEAAVAYRVWEHPQLAELYVKAYPHGGDPGHLRRQLGWENAPLLVDLHRCGRPVEEVGQLSERGNFRLELDSRALGNLGTPPSAASNGNCG